MERLITTCWVGGANARARFPSEDLGVTLVWRHLCSSPMLVWRQEELILEMSGDSGGIIIQIIFVANKVILRVNTPKVDSSYLTVLKKKRLSIILVR